MITQPLTGHYSLYDFNNFNSGLINNVDGSDNDNNIDYQNNIKRNAV